ncbi:MAG: multiheme c-type cytochrome [candidate division NC10 bacterium]
MESLESKWAAVGLVGAILLVVAVPTLAGEAKGNPYTSAKVCAGCHEDIYQMWSRSLHATALTDPVFDVVYMQVLKATDGKTRETCLRCHAPTTRVSRDFALRHEVTREGVTCDFCHTISVVNMNNRAEPYTMRPGAVKFGPLGETTSPKHLTTFSPVHETSELCGGCHELVAKNGTVIMGTYSEWKESPYAAKGVQCQDCHMPTVKDATTVKAGVKVSTKRVNKHDLQGGHSVDQLQRAARVEILEVSKASDAVRVRVRVTNVGSGHKMPTGIPSRKILLTGRLKDARGAVLREATIRYQKVLADAQHRPLETDADIFLKPSTILLDNRLGPQESRIEELVFPVTRDMLQDQVIGGRTYQRNLSVEVALTYSYTPLILQPADMVQEMAKDSRPLQ